MHRPRVAFQGRPGAYSHLACRAVSPGHEPHPCDDFEDAFDAVERGVAELAVLPVENSRAGRVAEIHRLLPVRPLHVIGEHYQPVRHQLLGLPGATLEGLRRVRSHPQALAQCRVYLRERGLTPDAATDTAGAAGEILALGDPSIGAIASALAGELHGLLTLDDDVADAPDNTTRFLVMSRDALLPPREGDPVITSCVFRVRNLPAALYKALGGFATNGVNLVKLESYQLEGFQWTRFAVDMLGHPDDAPVARALEELRYFCEEFRVLGAYRAHPFRGLDAEAG
ncbi:MAG: prephenate dehydratase [Alphaproteobacteria bacterium]|nr:prephenate dehydratase [Alphaproteobacteria bacterium]